MHTEDASLWVYQAEIIRVVDGRTLVVRVDMGFHTARTIRVRLGGVDTVEGSTHSEFVRLWVSGATHAHPGTYPFVIRTENTGGEEYYIAEVARKSDGENLAAALVEAFPSLAEDADRDDE